MGQLQQLHQCHKQENTNSMEKQGSENPNNGQADNKKVEVEEGNKEEQGPNQRGGERDEEDDIDGADQEGGWTVWTHMAKGEKPRFKKI